MSSALQQRRAELAAKQAAERKAAEEARQREREAASESAEQTGSAGVGRPADQQQAAQCAVSNGSRAHEGDASLSGLAEGAPAVAESVKPVGVATRSAVRPRGGARQGALGPFLARLRAAQD